MSMPRCTALLLAAILSGHAAGQDRPSGAGDTRPVLRVFLLAGQSNMEGQAVVDLDHEEHYNGGRGTLVHLLREPEQAERFAHLRDDRGEWVVRADVQVWYRPAKGRLKAGGLSIGYAVYEGVHHFGPELEFGHRVGDFFEDPVLLVKAAWGGKSLFRDFRPPSSGGTIGPYYEKMLAEYRAALADIDTRFPELAGHRPELTGFVWFQGWNDMFDPAAVAEYADNLVNLIGDLRAEFERPDLPVVVGETGNSGREEFRKAQAAVAQRPELAGNVVFVPTRDFLRAAEDSPNTGHGHHWFGNAESYLLIGDAMGRAMTDLIRRR